MADRLLSQRLLNFERGAPKSHHFLPDAFLNDFIEADERAAANEKNLLGINLNVLLMRMLASALWRNIARAAFQDFQQSLLHAFARDITRNAYVVSFAADLVDLVDVNNADLRAFHIVIRILQESENNILNIFAHVSCFGQRGRISDAKWYVENPRQCLGEQRFSRAGGTD